MSTKTIARMGLFIALSAVGAFLKIPSPTGTVALDSAPGYFAAATFGGGEAALVIALGHLLSSGIVGFPLTLPIHLLIAGEMAALAYLFGFLVRRTNGYIAVPVTVLANGILAPLSMVPIFGWPFFLGMVVPLLVGSLLNILVAYLGFRTMAKAGGKIAA